MMSYYRESASIRKFFDAIEDTVTDNFEQSPSPKTSKQSVFRMRYLWYSLAGVAAALAIVFIVHWLQPTPNEQLFAIYFTPANNEYFITSRGTAAEIELFDATEQEKLHTAFHHYEQNQYAEALKLFDEVIKSQPTNYPELLFYISVCQLQTKNITAAISNLSYLYELGNTYSYYQDAAWYLSLTYLKDGKTAQAKDILNQIITNEAFYAEKAKELMKEIR
jgi:tetratricopeptide (TPR) repeat protein